MTFYGNIPKAQKRSGAMDRVHDMPGNQDEIATSFLAGSIYEKS